MASNGATEPRSRRSLLAAGLGGLAAAAAGTLARPAAVLGANGDAVRVGAAHVGTTPTSFTTLGQDALRGEASGATGIGVLGLVPSSTSTAHGVQGLNLGHGNGVVGDSSVASGSGIGVMGRASSPTGIAAAGHSLKNSTGVLGASVAINRFPTPVANTGVYGYADEATTAKGVYGRTTSGAGVRGEATTGTGVVATATTGIGLAVTGRATFSMSGKASIPANASYVDVTVVAGGSLASSAIVFATLQLPRSGVVVVAARPNYPANGKIRIHLNKVASTTFTTPVAWIVFG